MSSPGHSPGPGTGQALQSHHPESTLPGQGGAGLGESGLHMPATSDPKTT